MNFRTEVFPKDLDKKITHDSKVLSLGSCFSVNIGNKLNQSGIHTSNNPVGTIFNPISLFNLLTTINQGKSLNEALFVNHLDVWMHHDLHSQFSTTDKSDLYSQFEKLTSQVKHDLDDSTHVIITLGTAFVYEHIETEALISNCHKVPQSNFKKRLLTVKEIKDSFDVISTLFSDKKVIFTLSPIRHTKEGIEENSLSKATLKLAINEICESQDNTYYFPSFEIFMDDLRDYRFYSEDLIHPNNTGIEYVWEKFKTAALDDDTILLTEKALKIKRALSHRPFNPQAKEHLQFLTGTLAQAKELGKQVNLISEIDELQLRIDEFRKLK